MDNVTMDDAAMGDAAMNKTVAVTGGSGFVGSHVVEALLARGYNVSCLVRNNPGWLARLPQFPVSVGAAATAAASSDSAAGPRDGAATAAASSDCAAGPRDGAATAAASSDCAAGPRLRIHKGDVDSGEGLEAFLAGCDCLVHAAGLTRAKTEDRFRVVNVLGSVALAAQFRAQAAQSGPGGAMSTQAGAAGRPSAPHIIAISSYSATGPAPEHGYITEDEALKPLSAYGRSKAEMERLMRRTAAPIPCTFLRAPPVYGPRDKDMVTVFKAARRGVRISFGDQQRLLSFLYVKNLVAAIIACIEHEAARGEDFMLADEGIYSWAEYADMAAATRNRTTKKIVVPDAFMVLGAEAFRLVSPFLKKPPLVTRDKVREARQQRWVSEAKKIQGLLGFSPPYTIQAGIAETMDWYEQEGWL